VKDGRIGFASSTRPGDVDDLVAGAIETAPFGPEAKLDFAKNGAAPDVPVHDAAVEGLSVDEMIEAGQSLIDAVRKVEAEVLCGASVRRSSQTIRIANSSGAETSYRATSLSMWVHGTLIRGTDMLFVGDGDASCRNDIDRSQIAASVEGQLERSRRTAQARTAELPVIFTSIGVADALLSPLVLAFSGRLVLQGQSPLAGRLGEKMYDPRFRLTDDATLAGRTSSRPVDDEGVPSRRSELIADGAPQRFLYDLQTAGLAGAESTASAERALTTQPAISTSSLLVEPGDTSFTDMVRSLKEGIVVEELMGAGQGNVMGGDFSGNVLLGYKVDNGEITGRVKDTMVAGNVHDALAHLTAIGSEARWVGGTVHAPPLLFEKLTVSAKG
jgi:PmbA protein